MDQLTKDVLSNYFWDVDAISIDSQSGQLMLKIEALISEKNYTVEFYNVHNLKIEDWSYPIQISGFGVESTRHLGWEKESRYRIYDFEEDKISFYCEDIAVFDCMS